MNELIVVEQPPIIRQQLYQLKASWEQKAADAEAMVCTEESVNKVKTFRAEMNKEFKEIEARRMQVKNEVEEPYKQFEAIYRNCVTNAYKRADDICKAKIFEVESDIKRRCEDGLREYFAELCAVRHLDWLEYERAGVTVDMASAKAKTPKKLREQLAAFVTAVGDSVDRILQLDDAEEIMVEFKQTLDAGQAICIVKDRHRRIEEQRVANEVNKAVLEREAVSIRKVEALAAPIQVLGQPEATITVKLIIYPTKAQFEEKIRPIMRQLKETCDMDGIRYE